MPFSSHSMHIHQLLSYRETRFRRRQEHVTVKSFTLSEERNIDNTFPNYTRGVCICGTFVLDRLASGKFDLMVQAMNCTIRLYYSTYELHLVV